MYGRAPRSALRADTVDAPCATSAILFLGGSVLEEGITGNSIFQILRFTNVKDRPSFVEHKVNPWGFRKVCKELWGKSGAYKTIECARLPGEYHGSGCTFASAMAVFLASGQTVVEAAESAQAYTWNALQFAFSLGKGQLLPNRIYQG